MSDSEPCYLAHQTWAGCSFYRLLAKLVLASFGSLILLLFNATKAFRTAVLARGFKISTRRAFALWPHHSQSFELLLPHAVECAFSHKVDRNILWRCVEDRLM